MKKGFILTLALFVFLLIPEQSFAMTLKTDWKIWDVNLSRLDLFSDYQKSQFKGLDISLNEADQLYVQDYLEPKKVEGLDVLKLTDYLESKIAPEINRAREDVTIDLNERGEVVFEGNGLYGRKLNSKMAAFALKKAIEEDLDFVHLPLLRDEPQITVLSQALQTKGINELVSSGETDFKGSPKNRQHNIYVGLDKFNGHLIPPGEEFSFGLVLGPVDQTTGYKKELVIKGEKTVPDYGGGLCQVSTTAYRAVLAAGLPVTQRRNHSYAVSYYSPVGLDATVYPPAVDMKFTNDSPNYLLMHSFTQDEKAYYNFYGTKDDRKVHLAGPYYYNRRPAPAPRIEYSTKLKPGEKEEVGHAVAGVSSSWYRQVEYTDPEKKPYFESIHSNYQARPDFTVIGVAEGETPESASILGTNF